MIDRSEKARRSVFGISLHGWEQLMLLSLLLVFATTAAVVILQRRESAEAKHELDAYKLTVEGKVAEAKTEGIKAGKAAGNALLRAAELEKQAEQLRKDTAQANARAAEAQLALEKFKQPRTIPDLRIFGEKLKQFAKTRFDMSVIPGDPEAAVLMSHIAASLEEAGWTWVAYNPPEGALMMVFNIPGKPNIGQEGWRGVSIQVFDEHAAELSPAANAIAVELKAVGIEVTR